MHMPQISNMGSVRGFATQRCLGGVAAHCVRGINNLLPFQDLPTISENKTYTANDTLYIADIWRYITRYTYMSANCKTVVTMIIRQLNQQLLLTDSVLKY